jgi:large subunit ribosomal protein L31e
LAQEENNKEEEEAEEELEETTETAEATEEAEKMEEQPLKTEAEAELKEQEAPAEEETRTVPEEVRPPAREKEEEEEIVEERVYTVPLGKAWIMPPRKRTPRAVRMLRSFITKHMKLEARTEGEVEEEEPRSLVITDGVNEKMWERGVEKPPRKIRVRATKDKDGNVTVYLAEGD